MPFPDDLLVLAHELVGQASADPTQARLRRAVSTAYYAVFHLLIDEAVSKWAIERQRSVLARTFDHRKMKGICDDVLQRARSSGHMDGLSVVAENFIELQQHRHTADYDNAKQWSHSDVMNVIALAEDAFVVWRAICGENASQDYLLRLFLPKVPPR